MKTRHWTNICSLGVLLLTASHGALAASGGVQTSRDLLEKDNRVKDQMMVAVQEKSDALTWYNSLETGLAQALVEYKPIMVFFTSSECSWCARMRSETFADPDARLLMKHYVLVELDVNRHAAAARTYGITGVPTMVFLGSDGAMQGGTSGFLSGADLEKLLRGGLNEVFLNSLDTDYLKVKNELTDGKLAPERWPLVMQYMSDKKKRQELRDLVMAIQPFPRKEIVGLLTNSLLTVRLGALEFLEEEAGTTEGMNPWLDEDSVELNKTSLERWSKWADTVPEEAEGTQVIFTSLTRDEINGYIRDILSDNRDRALRAKRVLESGGLDVVKAFASFLGENPDLDPAARRKLKEAQYKLIIPGVGGMDSGTIAHRILFGTQDIRLKTIALLQSVASRVVPVLMDFMEDPDSLVREAAADALTGAGPRAIPILKKHLEREKDNEVVFSILRCLGKIRSKKGLEILTGYLAHPNEDLVVAALQSISTLRGKTAVDAIGKCLQDPRWRVRVAALDVVNTLELNTLENEVVRLLDDKDDFVRYTAVKTLARVSSKYMKKLEELFAKDDALKAPIVAALCSRNSRLPRTFGEALDGKPVSVLIGVIDAMEDCGIQDLALIEKYVESENVDLACSAIRLVAKKGMTLPRYQGRMIAVLKRGQDETTAALLESLRLDPDTAEGKQIRALTAQDRTSSESDTNKLVNSELDMLLGAFEESAPAQPAVSAPAAKTNNVESPAPAPAVSGGDDINALFDAFGMEKSEVPALSAEAGGLSKLLEAIRELVTGSQPPQLRFRAALLLAGWGDAVSVEALQENFEKRTVAEREEMAQRLSAARGDKVIPLLQKLLRDPVETVRSIAVRSALDDPKNTPHIELVLSELFMPDTRLKAWDAYDYSMSRAADEFKTRRTVQKWVEKYLTESEDTSVQVLGLMLAEKCWKSTLEPAVLSKAESPSPYVRRAAYHTLGVSARDTFRKNLSRIMDDKSELVRQVIPAVYNRGGSTWVHYLDEKHQDSDYYSGGYYGGSMLPPRLDDADRAALTKLTSDISPKVKVEAYLSLLSNREPVDLIRFVAVVDTFPDREAIGRRVSDYLTSNYESLGQGFRVLLPYLENSSRDETSLDRVRKHFSMKETVEGDEYEYMTPAGDRRVAQATYLEARPGAGAGGKGVLRLVYFSSPGCRECDRVEKLIPDLKELFPSMEIEQHNIRKVDAMRLNEALGERLGVPTTVRLITPAIFAGGGYLVKKDITLDTLTELAAKSDAVPLEQWYKVSDEDFRKADEKIGKRYAGMSITFMLFGALDGINPCAFATLIFFISYLQVARRSPRQIAQTGLAFILAVFLAYFALGLGMVELVERFKILEKFTRVVNGTIAVFTLVIMVLSLRDGILCMRGKMGDMSLQLPGFLKNTIHAVIRRGVKHRYVVLAAFAVGVIISFLELACTGQVYAPTALYMLKTGKNTAGAIFYLLLYNLAFVLPLFVVFLLSYMGIRSETLTRWFERHAAAVKFATAGLFFALFLLFLFGDDITVWIRQI